MRKGDGMGGKDEKTEEGKEKSIRGKHDVKRRGMARNGEGGIKEKEGTTWEEGDKKGRSEQ